MAINHQIILYRLNPDGTIPNFLCKDKDGMGGIFLKYDPNTLPPQDNIMFGLSEYPVTNETPGIVGILTTKDDVSAYLNDALEGLMEVNPEDIQGEQIPVDIPSKIEWSWEVYNKKNGL